VRRINIGPQANFKTLVNKNAIKSEIGQFFLKALTPQGFWKKLELPPPLDFQPMCIYGDDTVCFFLIFLKQQWFCVL
jgi:hypothetical protein